MSQNREHDMCKKSESINATNKDHKKKNIYLPNETIMCLCINIDVTEISDKALIILSHVERA